MITMLPRHQLSKSTFMYGCQCPKRLWLNKFKPEVKDEQSEELTAIFQRGTDVGLLAQQKFPNGIDASPATPFEYQKSVFETATLIANGAIVIYEAAFQFNGILCAIDILVKENNKWYAYEVKSSTSAKDVYIQDAALQYYVITHSGLPLEDIFILHLNNEYVRYGDLDIDELFAATSILEKVKDLQDFIHTKIMECKTILQSKTEPVVAVSNHCNIPYACNFSGYCNKDIITNNNDTIDDNEEYISKDELKSCINNLVYPLYFLDFETWMTAVPEQDGHWAYRQIPFQFSLHIQQTPNGKVEHIEYLASNIKSSLEDFTNALLKNIGDDGCVVVYNKTFENMILNQLKNDFEDAKEAIENIQSRFFDLMYPFRKQYYYTPKMQGSYSLKYVLPALLPEFSYSNLTIGNGTDASAAFYNLQFEQDAATIEATRTALLEYCKLDTLAMVKILEKIYTIL